MVLKCEPAVRGRASRCLGQSAAIGEGCAVRRLIEVFNAGDAEVTVAETGRVCFPGVLL